MEKHTLKGGLNALNIHMKLIYLQGSYFHKSTEWMSLILIYIDYVLDTALLSSMQYFGDGGRLCMSQDSSIRQTLYRMHFDWERNTSLQERDKSLHNQTDFR